MRFVTAVLLIVASTAMAQEKLNLLPGSYRGHIDARNGADAFELTIETVSDGKLSGISLFHKGPKECRLAFPMLGMITADGSIHIDSKEGVLPGCERTFNLKVINSVEIEGTLVGPKGTWNVNLVKR